MKFTSLFFGMLLVVPVFAAEKSTTPGGSLEGPNEKMIQAIAAVINTRCEMLGYCDIDSNSRVVLAQLNQDRFISKLKRTENTWIVDASFGAKKSSRAESMIEIRNGIIFFLGLTAFDRVSYYSNRSQKISVASPYSDRLEFTVEGEYLPADSGCCVIL